MSGGTVNSDVRALGSGQVTVTAGSVNGQILANHLIVSGGAISSARSPDTHFSAGQIRNLEAGGLVSGGETSFLDVSHDGSLTVTGGQHGHVAAGATCCGADTASLAFDDGVATTLLGTGSATIVMSGGAVGEVISRALATVTPVAGNVSDDVFARDASTIEILGGSFAGTWLASETARIVVKGAASTFQTARSMFAPER